MEKTRWTVGDYLAHSEIVRTEVICKPGLTSDEIAAIFGYSSSQVRRLLRLSKMPESVKSELIQHAEILTPTDIAEIVDQVWADQKPKKKSTKRQRVSLAVGARLVIERAKDGRKKRSQADLERSLSKERELRFGQKKEMEELREQIESLQRELETKNSSLRYTTSPDLSHLEDRLREKFKCKVTIDSNAISFTVKCGQWEILESFI